MARTFIAVTVFAVLCSVAQAAPGTSTASKTPQAEPAGQYWLHDGLTRLVFWQPPETQPLKTGRSAATTR